MRQRIGSVEEFPQDGARVVHVDGREIAVWHRGERFYALRNACPHMGAPLDCATLAGTMLPTKTPKDYNYGLDGLVLRCPWHGYEFSIETGEPLFGESSQRIVAYPVTVDGQDVYLDTKALSSAFIEEGARS